MQDLEIKLDSELEPHECELQLNYSDDDDSLSPIDNEYIESLALNHRETIDESNKKIYDFLIQFSVRRKLLSEILKDTETDLLSRVSFAESLIQNTESDLIDVIQILEVIIKTNADKNNYTTSNNIVLKIEENSDEDELCCEHFNSPIYKKISQSDAIEDDEIDEAEDNGGLYDDESASNVEDEDEDHNDEDEDEDHDEDEDDDEDEDHNEDEDDDEDEDPDHDHEDDGTDDISNVLGESMLFLT